MAQNRAWQLKNYLNNMKKLLLYILNAIVDNQGAVEVKEEENEGVINFVISVAPEDMGKVIGKNGKIIKAIRNVVKILAIKNNQRIYISLAEVNSPQE